MSHVVHVVHSGAYRPCGRRYRADRYVTRAVVTRSVFIVSLYSCATIHLVLALITEQLPPQNLVMPGSGPGSGRPRVHQLPPSGGDM